MKTKERIRAYNKEYFARPAVIARAKIRNAQRRDKRKAYKKTEQGRIAERRWKLKYLARPDIQRKLENRNLIRRYGITVEQYKEMYKAQNGKCLICGKPEQKLHVDHCHETGYVRGLLCGSCNRALGLLKDNTDFLLKAIAYLQRCSNPQPPSIKY